MFALKLFQGVEFYDKEDLDQLRLEFQFIKTLSHINIMKGYELIETSDYFIIVSELIDG